MIAPGPLGGHEISVRVEVHHLVDPHPLIQNSYFKLIRVEEWFTMYYGLLLVKKKEMTGPGSPVC
jgi:hypothetical protein